MSASVGERAEGQRRRGAELEATILAAAWDELKAVGYGRLTMEGVAARAHTGKQVLYRRWPNRAELVIAALRHNTGSIADNVPDTGSLREDVLAVLEWMARRGRDVGPEVLHGIMADVPDFDLDVFLMMRGVMGEILARAAARGEIPSADLPARVATLPSDLLRHQLLLTREPVDRDGLVEIVDSVFLPLVRTTR